jgi:superfamily II DNA or RNA helicase
VIGSQSLNISQKGAIINTISADSFHLIIWPLGTGKTYVITEILQQLLSKGQCTEDTLNKDKNNISKEI